MWRIFIPTFWDWSLLLGSLGFFALLYLILVRLFPMVSMHEVRRLVSEEAQA
jgi:molybdopterin-containing oxidoreductase family membrane subunit